MQVPQGFTEVCRFLCPFCQKEVRSGSLPDNSPLVLHADPICDPFRTCDDCYQYIAIVNLKNQMGTISVGRN